MILDNSSNCQGSRAKYCGISNNYRGMLFLISMSPQSSPMNLPTNGVDAAENVHARMSLRM
jgi:hypothetical protein